MVYTDGRTPGGQRIGFHRYSRWLVSLVLCEASRDHRGFLFGHVGPACARVPIRMQRGPARSDRGPLTRRANALGALPPVARDHAGETTRRHPLGSRGGTGGRSVDDASRRGKGRTVQFGDKTGEKVEIRLAYAID